MNHPKALVGEHSPVHSSDEEEEEESIKIPNIPQPILKSSLLNMPTIKSSKSIAITTTTAKNSVKGRPTKRESLTINKDGSEVGLVYDTPPDFLGFSEKLGTAVKVLVKNAKDAKVRKNNATAIKKASKSKATNNKKSLTISTLSDGKLNKNDLFKPVIMTSANDQLKKNSSVIAALLSFLKVEHVSTLKSIFAVLDEDQDGLIDDDQLRTAILCTGLNASDILVSEIKARVPIWIRGGVDFDTFIRIMDEHLCLQHVDINDLYSIFRLNEEMNSGMVKTKELIRLLQIPTTTQTNFNQKDAENLMEMLNIKEGDEVSYKELIKTLSSGFMHF